MIYDQNKLRINLKLTSYKKFYNHLFLFSVLNKDQVILCYSTLSYAIYY